MLLHQTRIAYLEQLHSDKNNDDRHILPEQAHFRVPNETKLEMTKMNKKTGVMKLIVANYANKHKIEENKNAFQ